MYTYYIIAAGFQLAKVLNFQRYEKVGINYFQLEYKYCFKSIYINKTHIFELISGHFIPHSQKKQCTVQF